MLPAEFLDWFAARGWQPRTHQLARRKRIALGLKQMNNDPWEGDIPGRYKPGEMKKGKVTKLTNFGVFIELGTTRATRSRNNFRHFMQCRFDNLTDSI